MIAKLKAWVHNMLTEKDNSTLCPVRVGGVGAGFVYHVAAGWMVFGQHTAIDMALLGAYLDHMIKLLGTIGVAIGAKSAMKGDAPTGNAP